MAKKTGKLENEALRRGLARVHVKAGQVVKGKTVAAPETKVADAGNEQAPQVAAAAAAVGGRAPAVPDKEKRAATKAARQAAEQATKAAIVQVQVDMPKSAEYVAELVLDGATDDPAENFAEHQKWIEATLGSSNAKVRQIAYMEMYKASFGVECRSHEELNMLLEWLVDQRRMKRLGKVPKGHNPQGDIFHFGTDYKFCPEAGLSEAQVKALRAALAVTRGKIWRIVNARWKEAPTVMKAAMDAQGMVLTVDQFTSDANFQGDCLLEVPGKWVTGGVRGRRYMEGGLLLVRRTGSSCTAWMASNELLRADGEKAWGNFEWWFNRTIIAYDGLEAVSVPMSMILGRVKPSFTRSKTLAARNLACQRIRDAIGYMREKAAEAAKLASKPAEPAAAAPKKARKRATKKATAAK